MCCYCPAFRSILWSVLYASNIIVKILLNQLSQHFLAFIYRWIFTEILFQKIIYLFAFISIYFDLVLV